MFTLMHATSWLFCSVTVTWALKGMPDGMEELHTHTHSTGTQAHTHTGMRTDDRQCEVNSQPTTPHTQRAKADARPVAPYIQTHARKTQAGETARDVERLVDGEGAGRDGAGARSLGQEGAQVQGAGDEALNVVVQGQGGQLLVCGRGNDNHTRKIT